MTDIESALKKVKDQKENYGFMDRFTVDENWEVTKALEKQIPKRVFANYKREFTNEDFKGMRNTRYYCPCCKKPTKQTAYCDKCGQKLLFPTFHWTIYDGESPQIRTMTWGENEDD